MGKKKKRAAKVWCYYCEREFDDEKILIQHQKAKHFKCHACNKRLSNAAGMAIHVMQIHKETVTKVPNAKPDRESLEIEIFGMQGIPPDILAAHDGDKDDESPAKLAKVEVPASGFFWGAVMGSTAVSMPPNLVYSARQPVYATQPSRPMYAPGWPTLPASQPWLSAPPAIPGQLSPVSLSTLQPPQQPSQPSFPIQNMQPPLVSTTVFQPLFPTRLPTSQPYTQPIPSSQPLFPVNDTSLPPIVSVPSIVTMLPPSSILTPRSTGESRGLSEASSISGSSLQENSIRKPLNVPPLQGASTLPLRSTHMYAPGPNTGDSSIGPPPAISNKAPAQGVSNEVYLVWDDDAMSMEERKMSLRQYLVGLDVHWQMVTVDAAIDRRISELRLGDRRGVFRT